jgi:N-acetylmuramoyl-L-alanine amidase
MKKTMITTLLVVVISFVTAVGLCFRALTAPKTVFSAADSAMCIVIDAGHGGVDGGVTGKKTGAKESDLNLAIALKTAEKLKDAGFEIVLTRKTQEGLYGVATRGFKKRDMQKRKEIASDANPSLLVSIHQNLYPTRSPRGAQVFYRKNDESSKLFANCLQSKLNGLYAEQNVKSRKETGAEYFMLDCVSCPSVIVECGFLSNAEDERLLISETWQQRIAENITAGILAYLSV